MNQEKIRLSYTALNLWSHGAWEEAIKSILHLDSYVSPQMVEGQEFHQRWEDEIQKTRCLPKVFGGGPLRDPIPEKKLVWENGRIELVGVIDCLESPVVHEFKTGLRSSESYAGTRQPGFYAFLAMMNGYKVGMAQVHHFNQYTRRSDTSLIWVTRGLMEETISWINQTGMDIVKYFDENREQIKKIAP